MNKDSCFELGKIIKPHGLQGELQIHLDVDEPNSYKNLESVFVEIQDNLVPFFVESLSLNKNKGIIAFEDVESIEEAEKLRNHTLHLPLSLLPKLPDGKFYYHEVIGYIVVDKELGKLGTVESILTGKAQDLVEMSYQGKEILIPLIDEIVINANHEEKTLNVQLPEGLLDLYLS